MKTRNLGKRLSYALGAACLVCGLAQAASAASSGAQYRRFQMAGSTGVVDEKDRDEVVFKNGKASIDSSVTRGKVTLRYNVQRPLDNQSWNATEWWIGGGFRDTGDDARVVIKMKVIDGQTGQVTTVATFDSDDFGPTDDTDGFDEQYVQGIPDDMTLDYWHAVFVEVTLTRRSADGDPQIAMVHGWIRDQ